MANVYSAYKRQQEKKLKAINQRVIVTDLVVNQKRSGSGQYYEDGARSPEDLKALRTYVEGIANIANSYHEEMNFVKQSNQFTIKPDCTNHITRVLFPEFSLYTREKPLTHDEFRELIAWIEGIAGQLQPNLSLLISSVPVGNFNRGTTNHVIHVQCGPNPVIHVMTKINPSSVDPKYHDANGYYISKLDYDRNRDADSGPAVGTLLANKGEADAINTNYGGVFQCETLGGAKFFTAVDICLDLLFHEAKRSFDREIDLLIEAGDHFIPRQVSHVVTSNSIKIKDKDLVKNLVRADPKFALTNNNAIHPMPFPSNVVDNFLSNPKVPWQFKISDDGVKLKFSQSPFCEEGSVILYEPYPLSVLNDPALDKKICDYNEKLVSQLPPGFPVLFTAKREVEPAVATDLNPQPKMLLN